VLGHVTICINDRINLTILYWVGRPPWQSRIPGVWPVCLPKVVVGWTRGPSGQISPPWFIRSFRRIRVFWDINVTQEISLIKFHFTTRRAEEIDFLKPKIKERLVNSILSPPCFFAQCTRPKVAEERIITPLSAVRSVSIFPTKDVPRQTDSISYMFMVDMSNFDIQFQGWSTSDIWGIKFESRRPWLVNYCTCTE
jgi:hypothetical protein